MGSLYPDEVDEFGTDPTPGQPLAELHKRHHIDIPDAVEKIEKELGLNARGTSAFSVADRVAKAETRILNTERRLPITSSTPPENPQIGTLWIPIP